MTPQDMEFIAKVGEWYVNAPKAARQELTERLRVLEYRAMSLESERALIQEQSQEFNAIQRGAIESARDDLWIYQESGQLCQVVAEGIAYNVTKEHGKRIVACVNALRGIDSPETFVEVAKRRHRESFPLSAAEAQQNAADNIGKTR